MEHLIDQIAGAHSQFEALRRDIAAQLEATADEQEQHSAARPQPLALLPEGPDEVHPACALCVLVPRTVQPATCLTACNMLDTSLSTTGLSAPRSVRFLCWAHLQACSLAQMLFSGQRGPTGWPLIMLCGLLMCCKSCAVALHPGVLSTGSPLTDAEEAIGVLCSLCWHSDSLIVVRSHLLAAGAVPCPAGDATGALAQARDQFGQP